MPRPRELPPHLRRLAFRTGDVDLHGLSRGRLRSSDIAHPFYAVSVPAAAMGASVLERCRQYRPLLGADHAFSHVTAAFLHGVPLPARFGGDGPLHVSAFGNDACPRTRGVAGHRLRGSDVEVVLLEGLPVVGAGDTWRHLAQFLNREDLVAAGDYLVSGHRTPAGRERPLCTLDELRAVRRKHAGRRGVAVLDWALERIRRPVDSRPESLLRLLLVGAGFPEPIPNDPTPVDGGATILHPDLKSREYRMLFEYEGDGHREDPARFRYDIRRIELFQAEGWHVSRVTSDDLFRYRGAFLARVWRTAARRRSS